MPIESVKIKISKIGLRHVLSWPKLGLEPKFHDPGTFDGFGKQITNMFLYIGPRSLIKVYLDWFDMSKRA